MFVQRLCVFVEDVKRVLDGVAARNREPISYLTHTLDHDALQAGALQLRHKCANKLAGSLPAVLNRIDDTIDEAAI